VRGQALRQQARIERGHLSSRRLREALPERLSALLIDEFEPQLLVHHCPPRCRVAW
jgi:hypothetical protein